MTVPEKIKKINKTETKNKKKQQRNEKTISSGRRTKHSKMTKNYKKAGTKELG